MALKDVVEYIRDAITITYEDKSIPVFTQKSITDMYNDRLIHHGSQYDSIEVVPFARNTHATQVQEKIQAKLPALFVAKKGRKGTLTIDDKVGWGLYAACTWSSEEHYRIFTKTATAIRMRLFEKEECFDGDVSIERQVQSVPDILIKLISMILEGSNFIRSVSTSLHKISTNIAQFVCFNSVKRKDAKLLPLNKE